MTQMNSVSQSLQSSMRSLMEGTSFSHIRVEQICSNAGVSRKTFYHYYLDKYDLVNSIFLDDFEEILSRHYDSGWEFFERICTAFYEHRLFYLSAFEAEGQNSFTETFSDKVYPTALQYFRELFVTGTLNEFYARFFTDSFHQSLIRWMRDFPEITPDDYIHHLQVAAAGVARNFAPDSLQRFLDDDGDDEAEQKV